MAVLHPENPVQSLTKQQITDLLSGKLKTWESINGRKDPVNVVLNKAQVATTVLVPRFFLGKEEMPNADFVTTTRAVAEKIKLAPGTINFSGSKFEEAGIKLKFIDTDAKIDYVIGAKKPLTPEQTKLFQALKP
jgi:phosphate transport system substrate-binding protein